MSTDKGLMLDVGQADELKKAFRRGGWTNADIKRLCEGENAKEVLRFIRGEAVIIEPKRKWRKQNGITYFSVTSDGTTGEEWIKRLEKNGFMISGHAKEMLCSEIRPTSGVTTEIAVLDYMDYTTWKDMRDVRASKAISSLIRRLLQNAKNIITKEADAKGLDRLISPSSFEVACLIREKFSDKEIQAMGFSEIVVYKGFFEAFEGCGMFYVCNYEGDSWLCTRVADQCPHGKAGSAFAVSQVLSS